MTGSSRDRIRRIVALIAYPLLFAGMFAVTFVFRQQIWELATAPTELRDWVRGFGLIAPLIFIAVQVVQVVIFVIPGEVPQIASGYLFGIGGGLALTSLGIAIGSTIAFFASRLLGTAFLSAIVPREQLQRFGAMAGSSRATVTFFVIFLIPGVPKDVLCYIAGLSPMRFLVFLLISTVGRVPGIVGSVIMGAAAAEQRWLFAGIVLGIALILFVVGLLLRTRLIAWLERYAAGGSGTEPDTSSTDRGAST